MSVSPEPETSLREQLECLLADRHTPEARELMLQLMNYVHRRVKTRCRNRSMSHTVKEEIVSEVLLQLLRGSLSRFRGESIPELFGFVRTITDRTMWRVIQAYEREATAITSLGDEQWNAKVSRPDEEVELAVDSPLLPKDQAYLLELLQAGTKAELARRTGVSRAAVTQRVQRIRSRIDALAQQDRLTHDVWMSQAARRALERAEPAPPFV